MTGIIICFSIVAFCIIVILITNMAMNIRIKRLKKNMPPDFHFKLPQFAGRILPSYQVKPGTFTIATPFSNISSWGNDGILAFAVHGLESGLFRLRARLLLKAWRPDQKTSGVFELASAEVDLPKEFNEDYAPNEVKFVESDDTIIVTPAIRDQSTGGGSIALLVLFGFIAFAFGIVLLANKLSG